MEQEEDRKKKLAAGKEKLAAFRRKRAKKKKAHGDGGEGGTADSNGMEETNIADVSSISDLNSVTGESDQFSLTSGDEWSAEEQGSASAVFYQAKLAAANQRIAELEEAVEGKQLALDSMVMEMQSSCSPLQQKHGMKADGGDGNPIENRGSVFELHEALAKRDSIIRQLTTRLQETATPTHTQNLFDNTPNYTQETECLSHQVMVLQQQLAQAGDTLKQQTTMCQMSVQALQEAKGQILSLQVKVTEKNDLLQELSQKLASKSSELATVKERGTELGELVHKLQEAAAREAESRQIVASAVQGDASRVQALEEELEELANKQEESAQALLSLQQCLDSSEAMRQALVVEKEDTVQRLCCLEEELQETTAARDEALKRMSDLEQQMDEKSVAIMEAEADAREADARVTQLESEVLEMNAKHKMQIQDLNQKNTELELLLAERSGPSAPEMSDLKNTINSQQNEILSLRSQLRYAEEEISLSKLQTSELQQQLEELQMQYSSLQEKAEDVARKFEQDIQTLTEEKSDYKHKLESVEQQIRFFKEDLEAQPEPLDDWVADTQSEAALKPDTQDEDSITNTDVLHQITSLHKSYRDLLHQYTHLMQHNKHLQEEASKISETQSEQHSCKGEEVTVQSLQAEIISLQDEDVKHLEDIKEKNLKMQDIQVELKTVTKEKEVLEGKLQQQIAETENQILEADTQQTKLQGRISSLCLEVAQYKEALKESETAHLWLEEQYGTLSTETESLRVQEMAHEKELQCLQMELDAKEEELKAAITERQELSDKVRSMGVTHENELKALQVQLSESVNLQQCLQTEQQQASCSWESHASELAHQLTLKETELKVLISAEEEVRRELSSAQAQHLENLQDIQSQLEQKTSELDDMSDHCMTLTKKMEAIEKERESEIRTLQAQLQEKEHELHVVSSEKEELVSSTNRQSQQLEEAQQQLMQNKEECDVVSSQLTDLASELETTQNSHSKEVQDILEQLQFKSQACEMITTENEQLFEQLQSVQAAAAKDSSMLKSSLEQKSQELVTLLSIKACLEGQLAALEVNREDALQSKKQELSVLQKQLGELEQELANSRNEREALVVQLTTQADLFRVKEEEMVAENNFLNHQLEEVRSEAQQSVGQHRAQQDIMQAQLQDITSKLQTTEKELDKLREETIQQKGQLDAQAESLSSMMEEKNQLTIRLSGMEASTEDIQNQLQARIVTVQTEMNRLQEEMAKKNVEFDQEKQQMKLKEDDLERQVEASSDKIEQLQKNLLDVQVILEGVNSEKESLLQEQEVLQAEFRTELQNAQTEFASKENEFHSQNTELKDMTEKLKTDLETMGEEIAVLKADLEKKDFEIKSLSKENASTLSQVQKVKEEKEMLKNNFDCCMAEMTQQASERDSTIQQLQSQLAEASHSTGREWGQLREMYESQLSDAEDRLASSEAEVLRLKDVITDFDSEKEKLKENYNYQITELELSVQAAESEQIRLKDHASKMAEAHEKEVVDLKHSYEIQIASVEENCQHLEKALAKQECLMSETSAKYELEKAERERGYEQQLSEAFERARMFEMDVGKVKRQLEEMRKDHQKEREELQKSLETQIFELENKCCIATAELERMRQSLWSMEEDYDGEKAALGTRIQELEDICHSQEKEISDLQDKMLLSVQQSEDSTASLRDSFLAEISHMEEQNQRLSTDTELMRDQLKKMERTHTLELESLKHQYAEEMDVVQEKYRQAETYSQMLQSHMDSAIPSSEIPELSHLRDENEKLKKQLTDTDANSQDLQRKLREAESSNQSKLSELYKQVSSMTFEKEERDEQVQGLTQELVQEREKLHHSQIQCRDLEYKLQRLSAEYAGDTKDFDSLTKKSHLPSQHSIGNEHLSVYLTQELHHLHLSQDNTESRQQRHESVDGFEPEPDSLGYLDLAVAGRGSQDSFVEEAEAVQSGTKMRAKSVPSERFITERQISEEVNIHDMSSVTGRFEPEDNEIQPDSLQKEEDFPLVEESMPPVLEGFQPESVPSSPTAEVPTNPAPNQSFLPLPADVLPVLQIVTKPVADSVDSFTQTEPSAQGVALQDIPDSRQQIGEVSQSYGSDEVFQKPDQSGLVPNDSQEDESTELEIARQVKSMTEHLEEQWVQKMRMQEVELRHQYEQRSKEYQQQMEHQCQKKVESVRHESHVAFVEAVRKMRRKLEGKHKRAKEKHGGVRREADAGARQDQEATFTASDGEDDNLGDIVEQLHKENQELAEVRDELLEEIAISQTQGLRQTLRHELHHAFVAGRGKISPSHSLKSGVPAQDEAVRMKSQFPSASQQAEMKQRTVTSSQQSVLSLSSGSCVSEETHAVGGARMEASEEDETSFGDDGLETSSARERFLEELEEMSQQSGQDLPLEWELTTTTVSHTSTSAGDFEHDEAGSGSVWEVFDGRCPRQDCRELEIIKKQYEAEMDVLRQQLEVQRQHNDEVDIQLRTQYKQAVSSLREALGDVQQKELDAVVGQLQELHQRQLQQLHAQHLHDVTLQVTAMRVTVEQVQESRMKLMEEQHQEALSAMDKHHKDQLNTLQAQHRLPNGDDTSPLAANEDLTLRYQQLVQKISQSLEEKVLLCLHGEDGSGEDGTDSQTNGASGEPFTTQQAEAIQQVLQSQQEEVLSLRSQMLTEYESVLQQRSAGVKQQTAEVAHLQEEMTALQQQYEKQISDFQARLEKYKEDEEHHQVQKQQRDTDLEQVKAEYEKRIANLEQSSTPQTAAVLYPSQDIPSDQPVGGAGDEEVESKDKKDNSLESDSESRTLKLMQEREYVQKTATLTAVSDVDSDAAESPRSSADVTDSAKLQELKNVLEEKGAHLSEVEKQLEEEREKVASLTAELRAVHAKLADVSSELDQQREVCETLQQSVEDRDKQLYQLQLEKAESEKLLREYSEKENKLAKENEDFEHQARELGAGDQSFLSHTALLEEQVKVLKEELEGKVSALQTVEESERDLRERLEDAVHQHHEALEALRQELEHEAQVERETMQSEFRVQLDVELKRQAAELERQFVEQTAKTMGISTASQAKTDSDAEGGETQDSDKDVPDYSWGQKQVPDSVSPVTEENVTIDVPLTSESAASVHSSSDMPMDSEVVDLGSEGDSPHPVSVVQGVLQTFSALPGQTSGAVFSPNTGASREADQSCHMREGEAAVRKEFEEKMGEMKEQFEVEKNLLLEKVTQLEEKLADAEERYNKVKEDVEESEGAGLETLLKDRYDMELELTKNLMQQEFDDTLQAEKKKFVERHRKLMDEFMADREAEAAEVKQKHQQELEDLRGSLTSDFSTTISELQSQLQQKKLDTITTEEKSVQEPETGVSDSSMVVEDLQKELTDSREQLDALKIQHEEAMSALREEYEARITELKTEHQEQLEAAALDTDVMKSELEQAHQAELEALRQQLTSQSSGEPGAQTPKESPEETDQKAGRGNKDGENTPEVRSSLEYEETDEEGSVHSFSSMIGRSRTFAEVVKSPPPSSLEQEQRIKQLETQVEHLTEELARQQPQQETMTASKAAATTSPPPSGGEAARNEEKKEHSLVTMLQSDLDRISAERDAIQQTNNRLLQLLSDSVHTYVEVEDTINRRLHNVVSSSTPRPQTPSQAPPALDSGGDLVTPRGAGTSSFIAAAAMSGAGAMSSPRSDRSWRGGDADTSSPTLEETSILSNATDEGLDMSQRLTESIFAGPDIDPEGEEIVADARCRLQNAVSRLLELIERTTQQLLEAKATQADLLETMAGRSRENDDLKARLHDLEEQLRQEVSAKEYLGLELHKAEGLISGYSSERETLEEQLQLLEEQKEVLASDLETTRSRLQDFQAAAGELEARRQDVERHQTLLQQNAGQEAQASATAGGDADWAASKALLTEVNAVKQETREQTMQLQHRLAQAEHRLQEREATLEEMERGQNRQAEELRRQVDDLTLQLDNTDRQLKSSKQFLDEQMNEREQEREEFQKEVEKLRNQLQDREKQEGSHGRLQRENQDLTEQLQARIEKQAQMHQQVQQLQQSLQERDLSAQDLRIWINSLEKELDQRSDTEQQLKDQIGKLKQQLSKSDTDVQSDKSTSPIMSPRQEPVSPTDISPTHQFPQRRESRISLEEELHKSRRSEEELVHEKEALQKQVQEQLLQISALRNQLDEMRHWTAPQDTNTSTTSAADLREQLESEREATEKKDEEISRLKVAQESVSRELLEKGREVERLREELHENTVSSKHLQQLEQECQELRDHVAELAAAGPFPRELLEEKNAEIEDLQQQLAKTETDLGSSLAQLKEKEELVSDLQDTVHSLQRGEACLDVSLPFNEPVPLNTSFTERPTEIQCPSSPTSLAQELDQTVAERESRITELTAELEQLALQVTQLQEKIRVLHQEKSDLEAELQRKEEDMTQLQEEKTEKHEMLVEKESRLEQLLGQISSLQTEIASLTNFQVELQKDFDTVQCMLDEKEHEIESLTRELLDSRTQPDGSDVAELEAELAAVQRQLREQHNVVDEKEEELYELREKLESMDSIKSEVKNLQSALSEKAAELERERKSRSELQDELDEVRRIEHARNRANSFPSLHVKPLEEQVQELKTEILHLEGVVKDKEELVHYLEEEKAADLSLKDKDITDLRLQLGASQDELQAKVTELQALLKEKEEKLLTVEKERDDAVLSYQHEVETLQQQIHSKTETIQQLQSEQQSLKQQVSEKDASVQDLQAHCQQLRDQMKREVARLEEQLSSAVKEDSVATDDAKALQDRLVRASEELAEVSQRLHDTQTRLEQITSQLSEREEQIQQLQGEVQTLQQEARQRQAEDRERMRSSTPDSLTRSKTPDSSEELEVTEEGLKEALARAQKMQTLVGNSLSSSLPLSAEVSSLVRWESEPRLSAANSQEVSIQAQETEVWLRRQQRELAAKNRELARVRQELEEWLRQKEGGEQHKASVMSMGLRLQEKEATIRSLENELREAKALLAAAGKTDTELPHSSSSHSLSPQTKQQIAHLRSELWRAKAALAAIQDGSELSEAGQHDDRDRLQKMESELKLLRSSASMSAKDFVKKVQELREELTLEHQQHIRDIQEAARQDLEVKLTELQARHDHEMQQLQHQHGRRLEQALSEQQQAMEKQHKTEVNNLRVKHQHEIDRLRNEELASLTDVSVTQRLQADVATTQQMDQRMIGSLRSEGEGQDDDMSTAETNSTVSGSEDVLPSRLQALLNRLRELGDHVLSVSELDFLRRHLTTEREAVSETLKQSWEGEKLGLVKTIHALKELLSQADRVGAGLEETEGDWRSELVHALVEVYKRERLALEAELHTLRLQHATHNDADTVKIFDNRLREQEQLHQSGLDAMLRAERQSLLAELEDVHSRLVQQRREQQEQRTELTESLVQMEENASNTQWKLQRQVQVLEYKLQQEKVIEDDLKKGLEAERRRVAELSAELSRDKGTLISLQSELQSTQIHLSRTRDALEREQSRFTSVTDALEEEREKNNRLADMLENLRRQHHSLESDLGRTEAMRRERENADSKFVKELQAEMAVEREQRQKAVRAAEEARREKQQVESALEMEQDQTAALHRELEKVRLHMQKAHETEAAKTQELQKLLKQEQNRISELQGKLQDKEVAITQDSDQIKDLQTQTEQLRRRHAALEQETQAERRKADSLASILDSERTKQMALQEQEQITIRQLRHDLGAVKTEASEVRRHLELEKSRADGLRLEMERAQSELRAVTQHAGATERQLETEHSTTWNKLRQTQRERDELQMKVHELGLEVERLQDKLQDLELELDRSRQRELEARHDVERQKLYPSASPRTAPDTQVNMADNQLQKHLTTFCQQLQSVGLRLQTLTQRQRDHNKTLTESEDSDADGDRGRTEVEAVMSELRVLQKKMTSGATDEVDAVPVKLLEEELQHRVTVLTRERDDLRHRLCLLEDEDNQRTPRPATVTISASNQRSHQAAMPQYVSDATSDDEFLYERTVWASERLSLQMALDSAEHEIDRLKKELRQFRGRYDSEGFMVETDREKMQRLYGKYLRAESFRKALVYQKKYLLLLLGGYQDSEQETLAIIATMGGQPSSTFDLALRRRHRRLYTIFRSAARMVIAIFRMKYLVRKWKRAMRIGSPVVSGRINQQHGYMATGSSFSTPNTDLQHSSTATSAHVHTLTRSSALANGNTAPVSHRSALPHHASARVTGPEPGLRFYTPPTKDQNQSYRSSASSSSARRQLIHDNSNSSGAEDSGGSGGAVNDGGSAHGRATDDFLQRLENLQSRLSQNSSGSRRPAWR